MISELKIDRCIWVCPHDQNTSGFFICAFRKLVKQTQVDTNMLSDADWKTPEESKLPIQASLNGIMRCDSKDPDIEYIKTFYGLSDDFPLDQIFTFAESMNKLFISTKGLSDLLYADQTR